MRALSVLLSIVAVACASPEREPVRAEPAAPPQEPVPAPTAHAPAGSERATGAPGDAARGGLVLAAPPEWIFETPSSSTRKAQYRLPHGDESAQDASLVVFHFGGGGGSREANLERWAGQFEQPDGRPSNEVLQHSTRKVAGLDVLDVDLAGTYVAETAPGSGVRVREPDWRMLASIVEAPNGPWYFKLVGPAATVARWESSYRAFVGAVTPAR